MIPSTTAAALEGAFAAVCGAVLGVMVARAVEWLTRLETGGQRTWAPVPTWRALAVGAAIGAGVWWWEVVARGQLAVVDDTSPRGDRLLLLRLGAHMILIALLATASWIDIRLRVIPDAITIPGVLGGMVAAWAVPGHLLPVVVEVPRTFTVPALVPDVLGAVGGLGTSPLPPWCAARPAWSGLVVMLAVVAAWWWICTPAGYGPRLERCRRLCGAGLALLMVAAWWWGGWRHAALMASLAGIGAGGTLVWATRAGASAAMGREAMGLGDVTLMAMVGAWLGWQAAVLTFFLGVFLGVAVATLWHAAARDQEMPFGPCLAAGATAVIVGWRPLWRLVAPWFERPAEMVVVLLTVVVLTGLTLAAVQRWRGGIPDG